MCGQEMRLVPAGVSKKTGRAYTEFWACPNRCEKPKTVTMSAPNVSPLIEKPNWDEISWGKCKFQFMLKMWEPGIVWDDVEVEAEEGANRSMRKIGKPKLREIHNEVELDQVPF